MTTSAVPCGPQGAVGDLAAAGILAARTPPKFPFRIGVVEWVDEYSVPPIIKLAGSTYLMRYEDKAGTLAPGDRVTWFENGRASFIRGKMASTRTSLDTTTDDWFYTGMATDDHPAIGFRFFQGTADPNGGALFDVDIDPADTLVAHVNSAEYATGSRQWARPVTITADRKARISKMRAGHPFKLFMIVKNDSPPAGTPTYRYVSTGQNENLALEHPLFALATKSGTLDTRGNRDAGDRPTGADPARTLAVHARAMVNGESVDVSRYGYPEFALSDTPRVHPTGQIWGAPTLRPDLASADYTLTWMYSTVNRHDPTDDDLIVDHLGGEAIGQTASFDIIRYAGQLDSGGQTIVKTGIDNINNRGMATFGVADSGQYSMSAVMHSESLDEWRLADPRNKGHLNGKQAAGLAFVLEGGNTAAPI